MKKVLIPFILLLVSIICLQAQNVPFGMKYQAVARDTKGEVLAEKEISLEIKLLPNGVEKKAFYTETHKVTTNKIGLFSLTVGNGTIVKGAFKDIPWDKSEIWMSIGLDEYNDGGYVLIANSKLLAVPYAMHSLTAEKLAVNADSGNDGQGGDKAGAFWKLTGNLFTLPPNHFIGTRDNKRLIFKTNNINRMEITAAGDIAIANDLDVGGSVHIGENLVVDKNVTLNDKGGMTNNKGKFTVSQGSPSMLTGTLTVDGTTDLNSSLDVNNASPTNLTGTLNVDGTTDLNSSLDVNNASPTNLTGTLNVDGTTDLNSSLDVNNASPTNLTGTLNVDGTTDLNSSLDVNNASPTNLTGTLNVDGTTDLNSSLDVNNASPTNLTGTLNVDGTTDLNSSLDVNNASPTNLTGTLNVDGTTDLNSSLDVNNASPTNLTGTLNVDGTTDLNSSLDVNNASPTHLTGTLTVDGAASLGGSLDVNTLNVAGATNLNSSLDVNNASPTNLTGTLTVDGVTTLNNNLNVTKAGGTGSIAHFENTSNGNVVEIKVGASTPHNNNNFITFLNSGNTIVGRIEGEDGGGDYANNREYQDDLIFLDLDITLASIDLFIATAELVQAGVQLVAAGASSTACVGLGACVTAPIPSLIISEGANVVLATANEVSAISNEALVIAKRVVFVNTHEALKGITFASGAEDYAEYLPKKDVNEFFARGEVVGMKNGFITKNTSNADRIMVISFKPAVLGGLPAAGEEYKYEKVAFLGQIPTRVRGKVNAGDYVLPSGHHNGLAIGKNPKDMLISDYKNILGVAWESTDDDVGGLVNVAVGLNVNDLSSVVEQQKEEIKALKQETQALKQQIGQTNNILANLVPGFKEAANIEVVEIVETTITETAHEVHTNDDGHDHLTYEDVAAVQPSADDIIYYTPTRAECANWIEVAKQSYLDTGAKIADHPFWNRLATDASYTTEMIDALMNKFDKAIHFHKEQNAASQK